MEHFKSFGVQNTLVTYERCLVSLVQCAAVRTCLEDIRDPPHQNSVLRVPRKKIAASHGQLPGKASVPPTTRKFASSGCPHSKNC